MKDFFKKVNYKDVVKAGIIISGLVGNAFSLVSLGIDINGRNLIK